MAHPRVIAQRQGTAQARTRAAAETLAARFGLPKEQLAALDVTDRDRETQGVLRQEAVADLLEAVAGKAAEEAAAKKPAAKAEK